MDKEQKFRQQLDEAYLLIPDCARARANDRLNYYFKEFDKYRGNKVVQTKRSEQTVTISDYL